ncbi:TIGR02281 family clan AA aspartic protease [Simiduia curdlanivorans]|uniref:TIGR02281 family clan AA aspartic protease n=1 Tax=Simiduia curdlanivorans TaxID=1492769 RepID=A0ABV8VAA2_9GAMM|nr:TIGR02281 family clan AA aspartic protease [Simiduia curdlanivorans]MDN3638993.1 TIGR02281 family clan AA aspartic protease [Simiduia curdlanivorans]
MLTLVWICALGLLTLIFGRWEDNQVNPNQSPNSQRLGSTTEVTLTANRQHHYLANGQINNQPVTFLLDTGATHVSVPAHLAQKLGLARGQAMTSTTANGKVTVYSTQINRLDLGAITLHNLKGSINPGMKDDEILLGMSALKQLEIRQLGDQLTLIQHH